MFSDVSIIDIFFSHNRLFSPLFLGTDVYFRNIEPRGKINLKKKTTICKEQISQLFCRTQKTKISACICAVTKTNRVKSQVRSEYLITFVLVEPIFAFWNCF